jgi:hypothetical protein
MRDVLAFACLLALLLEAAEAQPPELNCSGHGVPIPPGTVYEGRTITNWECDCTGETGLVS